MSDNLDRIEDDDYFHANGLGHLLLGAEKYSQAEAMYASASDGIRAEAIEHIPLLTSLRWSNNLLKLKTFVGSNNRLPIIKEAAEKQLATWVQTQRYCYKKGTLTEERSKLLELHVPIWRGTGRRVVGWDTHLAEYSAFLKQKKRRPVDTTTDRDERLLAIWMGNQKTYLRTGALSAARKKRMDKEIPSWSVRERKRAGWEDALEQVKNFVEVNGRYPTESTLRDESFLGAWLTRQRESRTAQRDSRHQERAAILDRELPDWRNPMEQRWNSKLEELKVHIDAYGRVPLGEGLSDEDRKNASWLYSQRAAFFREDRHMDPDRVNRLDAVAPGWRDEMTKQRN